MKLILSVSLIYLMAGIIGPVQGADFNGDGVDDLAVFRPSSGLWAVRGFTRVYFGAWNDEPVPGNYNGAPGDEFAIYRATSGLWAIRGFTRAYYGSSGDIPIANGGDADWYRSGNNLCALASGNIGIGTDSPERKIHVFGSNPRILIEGDFISNPEINFRTQHPINTADWALYKEYNSGDLRFYCNGADRVVLEYGTGWLGVGTTDHKARLTVNGTILLKENATYNLMSGYAGVCALDSSGTTELYSIDGSGNITILSPHDPETQEWIFYSKNVKTGRVVRVDMERMVRYLDQLTGKDFYREWQEEPSKKTVEMPGKKLASAEKEEKIEEAKIESIPRLQERVQLLEEKISALERTVK